MTAKLISVEDMLTTRKHPKQHNASNLIVKLIQVKLVLQICPFCFYFIMRQGKVEVVPICKIRYWKPTDLKKGEKNGKSGIVGFLVVYMSKQDMWIFQMNFKTFFQLRHCRKENQCLIKIQHLFHFIWFTIPFHYYFIVNP